MSNLSIASSMNGYKVRSGFASAAASQRVLDSNAMLCTAWSGTDVTGRYVPPDSYNTKAPGCNSASDRLVVENGMRPNYTAYISPLSRPAAANRNFTQYDANVAASLSLGPMQAMVGSTGVQYPLRSYSDVNVSVAQCCPAADPCAPTYGSNGYQTVPTDY